MSTERTSEVYIVPDALITTSRNPGKFTDRFVKSLSALLGSPILRRGKDSLGDIAFNAKQNRFHTLLIVHKVKKKGFSNILLYKLANKYYKKVGTFRYELLNFKDVRKPYDAIQISIQKEEPTCVSFSESLQSFFLSYPEQKIRSRDFKVEIKNFATLSLIASPENRKKLVKATFKNKDEEFLSIRGYIENEN